MFAAPMPIISWLGSTSSPRRAAKLVAVAIVSVKDTSVMPTAAMSRGTTLLAVVHGNVGVGIPRGRAPTVATPSPASPSNADAMVAPTTPTSTAGRRVVTRGSASRSTSTATPTKSVVVCVWSRLEVNARISARNESACVEKPNSFGSWPMMIVIARPFMYPTCTSFDRRSATNPSLPSPSPISVSPTRTASMPASAIALAGSLVTSSGVIAARIKGEIEESGPSTSTRDGPNTA
jgi:hypothetical protein